ncbi:prefoldin subunit alpha [Candidatus Micrarchaeota archaeon]|nr:prefoldin subunit alpha [Candidatus Micrarchaeota archaeon]
MATSNSDREIQENVIRMRYIENQAKLVQQQMIAAEEVIIETATALNALKEMQKMSGKTESLTPLGAGVFISSVLEKPSSVLVDVGSGVVAEKPVEEAIKTLEERQQSTRDSIRSFDEMLRSISAQYEASAQRVQELRK